MKQPGKVSVTVRTKRGKRRGALARQCMQMLRQGADVRRAKVRRVRASIRTGAYENELKLHVAIDRLCAEV